MSDDATGNERKQQFSYTGNYEGDITTITGFIGPSAIPGVEVPSLIVEVDGHRSIDKTQQLSQIFATMFKGTGYGVIVRPEDNAPNGVTLSAFEGKGSDAFELRWPHDMQSPNLASSIAISRNTSHVDPKDIITPVTEMVQAITNLINAKGFDAAIIEKSNELLAHTAAKKACLRVEPPTLNDKELMQALGEGLTEAHVVPEKINGVIGAIIDHMKTKGEKLEVALHNGLGESGMNGEVEMTVWREGICKARDKKSCQSAQNGTARPSK